ncbi:hypothetical protein AV530_015128 [Patagioenas fasciata monilis]|uniref:Uncharacterized protein n=1 Tax=Patagioenas fasciata monilis TaxID=372326 RepID=A0A1V4K1A7_PATFA|nr:hypothetical protein AV530_015128 [Patagioenas fasciata monilis]
MIYTRLPSPPDHEEVLSLTTGAVLLYLVDAVEDGKRISSILLVENPSITESHCQKIVLGSLHCQAFQAGLLPISHIWKQ